MGELIPDPRNARTHPKRQIDQKTGDPYQRLGGGNATIAGSIATAIAIAAGNSLEAVIGAYGERATHPHSPTVTDPKPKRAIVLTLYCSGPLMRRKSIF